MIDIRNRVLAWFADLSAPAGDLIERVQSVDPTLRAVLAGLAALLETNVVTGLLVPGDTIVLVASAAVASASEGVLLGTSVAIGAFVGEMSGFALGRWVRRRATGGSWLLRRAGEDRIGPIARAVEQRGGPWILASRFIPVLRTITPFVVGLHEFPFRRFIAWSAPSCVLWSGIFVTIYAVAASPLRDGAASPLLGAVFAAIGAVLFGLAVLSQHIFDRGYYADSGRSEGPTRSGN